MKTNLSTSSFKYFGRKCLGFLPLVAALGYIDFRVDRIPNTYSLKRQYLDDNKTKIELLALGSSHALFGFDPGGIPCLDAFNLANNSQSLSQDAKLVRKFAPRLESLKKVIFFISYFSFGYLETASPEAWRNAFYVRHFGISETWKGWFDLRSYFALSLYGRDQSEEFLKRNFRVSLADNLSPSGWLRSEVAGQRTGDISDASGQARVNFHHKIMDDEYWKINRDEIAKALRALNPSVEVSFLLSPTFDTYQKYTDPVRWQKTLDTLAELSKGRPGTRILAPAAHLWTSADFLNNDHLNAKGAAKLSSFLRSQLCQ